MADQANRDKVVDQAISQIEKQFGRGSIMKLGDSKAIDVPAISTGALSLDLALGVGGVPRGRVVEIYGPESSGKTTLALHIAAEAQAAGGVVGFVDAEHALDVAYARNLGIDVDSLLVSQPDTGEQALDITEILVRSGAIDLLIIDSVAALVPKAEIEGDMGDSHMGLQAGFPYGPSGAPHVPGAQEAYCNDQQIKDMCDLYQSDQDEDWCHVWKSRNNYRRERIKVLCHPEAGYTAYWSYQGWG